MHAHQALVSFVKMVVYLPISVFALLFMLLTPRRRAFEVYDKMDSQEHERRITSISKYVKKGDTVLDIGSGSGRFGKKVSERLGVAVSGVDVCEYSDASIPVHIYDGKRLPFGDKSFDVVFFAFVLHHTDDHLGILREAARVSRKRVIVFEDTYFWPWELAFIMWNDFHTNMLQGAIKHWKGYLAGNPAKMPMPMTFRTPLGWVKAFSRAGLKTVSYDIRSTWYKPLTKITFQLET